MDISGTASKVLMTVGATSLFASFNITDIAQKDVLSFVGMMSVIGACFCAFYRQFRNVRRKQNIADARAEIELWKKRQAIGMPQPPTQTLIAPLKDKNNDPRN